MNLELLDGTVLPCYPTDRPGKPVSDKLSIDTSGEYLAAKCQPKVATQQSPMETAKRFLDNIALFLSHEEKILSDSRIFLAPVPIQNGLAYTGTSGFLNPTLGIYVEWWRHFHRESHDMEGNPIWFISGSPLSGCHACSSVNINDGTTSECKLSGGFIETWRSFMDVNNRYNEAKAQAKAYSLDEAIEILSRS